MVRCAIFRALFSCAALFCCCFALFACLCATIKGVAKESMRCNTFWWYKSLGCAAFVNSPWIGRIVSCFSLRFAHSIKTVSLLLFKNSSGHLRYGPLNIWRSYKKYRCKNCRTGFDFVLNWTTSFLRWADLYLRSSNTVRWYCVYGATIFYVDNCAVNHLRTLSGARRPSGKLLFSSEIFVNKCIRTRPSDEIRRFLVAAWHLFA